MFHLIHRPHQLASALLAALICVSSIASAKDVPLLINYQGKIDAYGNPVNGPGYFKFSIINDPETPSQNLWTQDGSTPAAGGEPSSHITLSLAEGRFAVKLGDINITNMTELPTTITDSQQIYLRTWFSANGSNFEALVPDKQLISVPFAYRAQIAEELTSDATISYSNINTAGATNLVSKIIGGPGIAVTPESGVGEVTITATGDIGFDATTLDGLDSTDFAATTHHHSGNEINSGTVAESYIDGAITRDIEVVAIVAAGSGEGSGIDADMLDGLSSSSFALTTHPHSGNDITSGTIAHTRIDSLITRDDEVISIVLNNDGSLSTLDADTLDGLDSSAFALSGANGNISSITRPTGAGTFDINIGAAAGDNFVVDTNKLIVEGDTGHVGIGTTNPSTALDVNATNATVASFNRLSGNGIVIEIKKDGVTEGSIDITDNTVSYNAFTGSHYALISNTEHLQKGMLISLTGNNQYLHNNPHSEIIYGGTPTSKRNDSTVLGAYLGLQNTSIPADNNNPHLVMAVGNGVMWVVENGTNVAVGDYLISSATLGHAETESNSDTTSHVVARAAENIDWSNITETVDGKKHALISVFYESFEKPNMKSIEAKFDQLEKILGL